MLDLLIKNGLIIDGSGSPGFHGAVLVDGDRVTIHRGDVSHLDPARIIDATGHVVCPGFIDLHSHTGLTILGEPHHDPKVRQGVTTELIGIDGISHAPFKSQEELHRYIWLDSGLNGYPPMPADWLTVAEMLGKYDNGVAINIAYILGNSPVRIWSVGWNDRPATGSELEEMKSVVREAMEEGAWGLSTGLDYPPGSYADTDELAALAQTDDSPLTLLLLVLLLPLPTVLLFGVAWAPVARWTLGAARRRTHRRIGGPGFQTLAMSILFLPVALVAIVVPPMLEFSDIWSAVSLTLVGVLLSAVASDPLRRFLLEWANLSPDRNDRNQ